MDRQEAALALVNGLATANDAAQARALLVLADESWTEPAPCPKGHPHHLMVARMGMTVAYGGYTDGAEHTEGDEIQFLTLKPGDPTITPDEALSVAHAKFEELKRQASNAVRLNGLAMRFVDSGFGVEDIEAMIQDRAVAGGMESVGRGIAELLGATVDQIMPRSTPPAVGYAG